MLLKFIRKIMTICFAVFVVIALAVGTVCYAGQPTPVSGLIIYNFNFNNSYTDSGLIVGDDSCKFTKNTIIFKPGFYINFRNSEIEIEEDFHMIKYLNNSKDKILLIAVNIVNNLNFDRRFNVDLECGAGSSAALKEVTTFKVYDYAEKTYSEETDINASYVTRVVSEGDSLKVLIIICSKQHERNEIVYGKDMLALKLRVS